MQVRREVKGAMAQGIGGTAWKVLVVGVANLIAIAILLFVVEGFASFFLAVRQIAPADPAVARPHSQYDAEIGWIHKPDVYLRDFYGPGRDFRTNSQSFRNARDFAKDVPPGKVRIVCSGDSFTMGQGVGNDQAWCQRLAAANPRIESVNLGHNGYGVDQAYLWYKRNSDRLEHDVHIFAFISGDFLRMKKTVFRGYGKPTLALRDGALVVENVPVPMPDRGVIGFERVRHALGQLSVVKLRAELFPSAPETGDIRRDTREVAAVIFEDLARINREKGSTLVLVFLPTLWDYRGSRASEGWREFVRAEATHRGWLFVDVTRDLRKVSRLELKSLFRGHYTEKGNAFVAGVLSRELLRFPETAEKIR
jgi:hypothetical protein